jgi:hypothetical protein
LNRDCFNREASGSMRAMDNKKVVLPIAHSSSQISPNSSLNKLNPLQIKVISYR